MRLLGAFTDGDLRRSLQRRGAEALSLPLSAVMTSAPRTCRSDLKAVDAMQAPPHRHPFYTQLSRIYHKRCLQGDAYFIRHVYVTLTSCRQFTTHYIQTSYPSPLGETSLRCLALRSAGHGDA